ncbi:DUF3278 domain-containing protein [Latilactobacillus sakei]|uniref:DUF3278 domain-containing protein n=1 Tax=Latilactobacillus sakei TaxID=1599 RepID=UPI000977AF4E|nr:DUF3278 domain-containing protein [Latilactobacillus sakei]MCP8851839.1 DUF3278 domain-containing protein [Latilactobacillus sakei]RXA80842.1 DUF3278 domain-containing protein [Latilactobacillus sakei]UNC22180.1 DUF3278 domain-containing protein [Latilactobacillus sakei]UNC24007.1 DUF3278 domain-containing protein [Latilactobacillus sakei]SOB40345.1 conserved membrane hypothetical protein [Latilactobacillus sakei]
MLNRFEEWLLKQQIGYLGARDEQQSATINHILVKANLLTYCVLTILMFVSLIWDLSHGAMLTLGTFFLILTQLINSVYTARLVRKAAVDQTEFYDTPTYQAALKQLKVRSVWRGINWAVGMFIWLTIVIPFIQQRLTDASWTLAIIWGVSGIIVGVGSYFRKKKDLHLLRE